MTSAPAAGCVALNCERSASAGGQLEQPSDVKSSTRTGVRTGGRCAVTDVTARTAASRVADTHFIVDNPGESPERDERAGTINVTRPATGHRGAGRQRSCKTVRSVRPQHYFGR